MDKQIYDLTSDDIIRHSCWYFPMDESVEDEATVRPLFEGESVPDGLQMIVRCRFTDALERSFVGYAYSDEGSTVECSRPVAWLDGVCVTFWNGMLEPSSEYLQEVRTVLPGRAWPVRYESDPAAGVVVTSNPLVGLYYAEGAVTRCRRV